MKKFRVLVSGICTLGLLAAMAMVIGSSAPASGQAGSDAPWTQIGSAGTIDEADLSTYQVGGIKVEPKSSAPSRTTVDVRYNVVGTDGLFLTEGKAMTVRFADNGNGARVLVTLNRTNLFTGVTSTLLTLDSDTCFGCVPATTSQARSVRSCSLGLDFNNNVYWIEASITKSSSSGVAALLGVKLAPTFC